MRILHIFDHSLPFQSGYVFRSLSIIRGQRSIGWETVHLTTPRYHPSNVPHEMVDGLKFYRSPAVSTTIPVIREYAEMLVTRRTLDEIVRAEKPDLLHAHSPVLNVLPAISTAKKFGLPVVYEVRALWEDAAVDLGNTKVGSLRYRASRALDTYALSRVDKVVVLCNPLRSEIGSRGISADKITVVPNAVDPAFLGPAGAPDPALMRDLDIGKHPVIGFVGSFYAYEGLDLLLEAVPLLSRRIPNFTILLVGGGPEEDRLRRIVHQTGIERYVRFTGRIPHGQVRKYYDLIDVCAFPRRKIRLTDLVTPLKPLEAMALSKPIVASDVGGHREQILDSKTGYLFSADDVIALAARLASVISNSVDATRIGANGRRHVESHLTWEIIIDRYRTIYEDLLAKKPPRA